MTSKANVGIVGYGVIGKRIADAVAAQSDMNLIGVADIISDVRLRIAVERKYPIYCSVPDFEPKMREAGYEIVGYLEDMVKDCDIVMDCTPSGVPEQNFPLYDKFGVKTTVQGGEKHGLTNRSFSTFGNYYSHLGVEKTRVVSCNTTALTRIVSTLANEYGIADVFVALARRAGDPARTNRGPINAITPVLGKSHHGPDLVTVIPNLQDRIHSLAIAGSWTLSHVHMLKVTLNRSVSTDEVVSLFKRTPRILIEPGKQGLFDSAQLVEYFRDLGRPRYDRPEVFIWQETLSTDSRNNLYLIYDVHMESIPIPENVDVIRAMLEMESSSIKSVEKTDKALKIDKNGAYSHSLYGETEQVQSIEE
ncbi:MAG: type II glyceraldehyde-3-phosphate dehydrogenase [Candidatus Hodarchaeales archaeon]|jgi:glyceraldehyde-3-phosphate dehydrogenase (NAD(P))